MIAPLPNFGRFSLRFCAYGELRCAIIKGFTFAFERLFG